MRRVIELLENELLMTTDDEYSKNLERAISIIKASRYYLVEATNELWKKIWE